MKRRILFRWRDDWEITHRDAASFAWDCLKILMIVFGGCFKYILATLKALFGLAVIAAVLYGVWRLMEWLFFIVFGF